MENISELCVWCLNVSCWLSFPINLPCGAWTGVGRMSRCSLALLCAHAPKCPGSPLIFSVPWSRWGLLCSESPLNPALTVFCNVCSDLNLIISVLGFPLETRSTVSTWVLKAVHSVQPLVNNGLLSPTQPSPHWREQLTQARHSLGVWDSLVMYIRLALTSQQFSCLSFPSTGLHYSAWLIFSSSVRIEPRDLCILNEHSTSEHLATHPALFIHHTLPLTASTPNAYL